MKHSIETERHYTLNEICKYNFCQWIKSIKTLRSWIHFDMKNDNILNTRIIGKGNGLRYYIQGKNIIQYITAFEDGSLFQNYKK